MTGEAKDSENNIGAQWLRNNFWNLLVTLVGLIIAYATMNNKISSLEVRAQTNYDRIIKLEEAINQLPNKETLSLELAPMKADLQEIKKDLKEHLQRN
jgi:hypothetical protein